MFLEKETIVLIVQSLGQGISMTDIPKSSPDFEREKWLAQIELEREKSRAEQEFRSRELTLKERAQSQQEHELALKRQEARLSRWTNPLALAIFGAAFAGLVNAGLNALNNRYQLKLEREKGEATNKLEANKSEAARILEMIKTSDSDKAAENLRFLVDSGLLAEGPLSIKIRQFLEARKPGTGPFLASSQPIFQGPGASISKAALDGLQGQGLTLGVTVSHFNSAVDFQMLKERGIRFAFIKASQGATSVDRAAEAYARAAKQAGVEVGLYHFFTNADVSVQFANFLAQLTSIPWNLPPTIDCEQIPGSEIPSNYASRVAEFATKLEQQFGIKPIIYTTWPFANEHLDQQVSKLPLFVAQYRKERPSVPKWWTDYVFWHVAEGVHDDQLLKQYDIVAFKGQVAALAGLSAGRK